MSETLSKAVLRLQSSIKQLQILKGSATVGELAQSFALDIETHELALAEITSLRAQLDEAKCKIEELGTHCALHESLAHGYTDEIAELQCRVDEARRKAIEDAAKTAEAFAKNHVVQWGDRKRFELHDIQRAVNGACGLIAEDIRALLSESKT